MLFENCKFRNLFTEQKCFLIQTTSKRVKVTESSMITQDARVQLQASLSIEMKDKSLYIVHDYRSINNRTLKS